jgi:hypothetical protein
VASSGADVSFLGYIDNTGATVQGTATASLGYGAYLWAYRVNTAFSGDALSLSATMTTSGTANFGAVVLSSALGTVDLLDTASFDEKAGVIGAANTGQLVYDLGTATAGYYVESADTVRDITSFPVTDSVLYDKGGSGATQRLGVSGAFSGSTLSSDYVYTSGANWDGLGLSGMAFVEVIPEPATLGVIGFFGTALIFIRRRFLI